MTNVYTLGLCCEWDEEKNEANRQKHCIDFMDALEVFEGLHLLIPSPRNEEERWLAIGMMGDVWITVVFTVRGSVCRIISARRARRNEREAYRKAHLE